MKTKLKTAAMLAVAIMIALACKQTEQGSKSDSSVDDQSLNEEEIKASIEEMVFPLPEPMGVYTMLEEIGAEYDDEILNPVTNLANYHTSNVKAANLGVYAADLSYTTVYQNDKSTDSYTKTIKSLIDDLEIEVDYKKLLNENTEEAIENSDSLIKLTSETFIETYDFLKKESEPSLAVLMVNGFYIEGLYIATQILEGTYDNVEMVKIIYSQAKPLDEIINLNEKFIENEYIKALQKQLITLKSFYETNDGSLTKEQLTSITKTIEAIRSTLIS